MRLPRRRDGVRQFASTLLFAALIFCLQPAARNAAAQELPEANATVRIVHATPGAPDFDVLLDGQPLLEHLAPSGISEYLAITPGAHRLQVVPSGQPADAALVDLTLDAAPGRDYLLAVFGRLNDVKGAIFDVDLSEIEPGNARVRLINLSPDAGDIDLLQTGGDEWFGNVAQGQATDYLDILPGAYSADLRGTDDRILRTIDELIFQETRVYDVVALGQVADDSLQVLALETIVSPPCAEVLGLEGEGSNACVRIVHAAPDVPAIDVSLNDAQLAQGLQFGSATDYAAVPSGEGRVVRIVATGGPADEASLEVSLDFQPGQAYELVMSGAADDLGLTVTGTDLRPVAAGQARVRVVNVSPELGAVDIGESGDEATLFAGVDFGEATGYLILDAGEYPFEVKPGGDETTVALRADVTLEEGMVYDLVILGRPDDQSLTMLALTAPVVVLVGQTATPAATAAPTPLAETGVQETSGAVLPATPAR